jgi:hypothetical protein
VEFGDNKFSRLVLNSPIEDHFDGRVRRVLSRAKIRRIVDLVQYSETDLSLLPGFSNNCLKRVNFFLKTNNLALKVPPGFDGPVLNRKTADLFSVRTKNCLAAEGIQFVGELVQKSAVDLLKITNFGKASLREVEAFLSTQELTLETKLSDWSYSTDDLPSALNPNLDKQVLNMRLDTIFDNRASNSLAAEGIQFVGELVQKSAVDLLKCTNFGKTSLREVTAFLSSHRLTLGTKIPEWSAPKESDVEVDPRGRSSMAANVEDQTLPGSLRVFFDSAMEQVTDTQRKVFFDRYCYEGRDGPTLEAVGKTLGVTRERIRQIESKALRKLRPIQVEMERHLNEIFENRTSPVYLHLIGFEDDWFSEFESELSIIKELINRFYSEFFVWDHKGLNVLSKVKKDRFDEMVSICKRYCQDAVAPNYSKDKLPLKVTELGLQLFVERCCSGNGDRTLADLVLPSFVGDVCFSKNNTEDGEPFIVAFGNRPAQLVLAVVRDSPIPLTTAQIRKGVKARFGKELDDNTLRSSVQNGKLETFSRGTYGTIEHLEYPENVLSDIRQEVIEIFLSSEGNRQWHCHDLLDELALRRPDLLKIPNGLILNIILRDESELEFKGRQIWALKSGRREDEAPRIEVHMALEVLLRDSGRVMSQTELKQILSRKRGLGKNFQIFPKGNLIRMRSGYWGLIDRDVPLSQSEQSDSLDKLALYLERLDHRIGRDDVMEFLRENRLVDLGPDLLLGLAERDERFNMARGRELGLS